MLAQIGQPDRLGLPEHEAKDAVAARRGANPCRQVGVDPVSSEMLEQLPVGRDDPNGRVAGPDDFCGHLYGTLKHTFKRDFGNERRRGRLELLQAFLCGRRLTDCGYGHTEKDNSKRRVVMPKRTFQFLSSFLHKSLVKLSPEPWKAGYA